MTTFSVNIPADVSFTPDSSAYADGDVVGGLLTFTFSAKSGLIVTVLLSENANLGAVFDLFLFNDTPTTFADSAVFAPVIADMKKIIRKIPIASTDYFTENSLKTAQVDLQNLGAPLPFSGNTVYGYLVTNGSTPTFGASKTVQVRLIPMGES